MTKVIAGASWPASVVTALAGTPWPVWVAVALLALTASLAPHVVRLVLGLKALDKASPKQVAAVSEALFLERAPVKQRKSKKRRKK